MRIPGQAIAFAVMFVVSTHGTIAAELLPPERPIAEAVDHYIDETLRKDARDRPHRPMTRRCSAA